jgi:hypothetical protein
MSGQWDAIANLIAQEPGQWPASMRAIGRVLLIVIAAVVIFVLALWAKRQFLGGGAEGTEPVTTGFGISDLRKLRDEGKLTNEEFERARDKMIAQAKKKHELDREPPVQTEHPESKNLDLIRDAEE